MKDNYTHQKQSVITFQSKTQVATLKERIQSVKEASYSTVLTLAGFLLHHMPDVPPPTIGQFDQPDFEQEEEFPSVHMTYNELYQPWCDYLTDLYIRKKVEVMGTTHHFKALVKNKFISKLDANFFDIKDKQIEPALQGLNISEPKNEAGSPVKKKVKRIGVVNFATSQLRKDKIQPKMHIGGLFTGIFFAQGDQWKIFNVLAKKYPTQQQYKDLDVLIMSGSSLYINQQPQQVAMFLDSLKKGIKANPNLKILGICFGHQALTKLFGGKINQNEKTQTGTEAITFDQQLIDRVPYFRENNIVENNTFELSEFHSDFVTRVPQDFQILAQSPSCQVESLVSKNMKYLSFQFHPQYSAEYIKGFEMRTTNYQDVDFETNQEEEIHTREGAQEKHMDSLEEIRITIRNFMDWEAAV